MGSAFRRQSTAPSQTATRDCSKCLASPYDVHLSLTYHIFELCKAFLATQRCWLQQADSLVS